MGVLGLLPEVEDPCPPVVVAQGVRPLDRLDALRQWLLGRIRKGPEVRLPLGLLGRLLSPCPGGSPLSLARGSPWPGALLPIAHLPVALALLLPVAPCHGCHGYHAPVELEDWLHIASREMGAVEMP